MKNKRTVFTLTPKVEEVVTITLESVIPDLRPLVAALYLSLPDEIDRIREEYPGDHIIHFAVKGAVDLHRDEPLRNLYAADGFFTEQLEHILRVAKKDRLSGARLVPVLYRAVLEADSLNLPYELKEKIEAHISWQRNKDGFAIAELSRSKSIVIAAKDVTPA